MSDSVKSIRDAIGKVVRERQQTKAAIDRLVSQISTLRTTYAHQGVRIDRMLEDLDLAMFAEGVVRVQSEPLPCYCSQGAPVDDCPMHTGQVPGA